MKEFAEDDLIRLFQKEDILCVNCRGKLRRNVLRFYLGELKVTGLYVYEEACKDLLLQYKEFYDEALAPVFFYGFDTGKYRGWSVVLVPSSEEKERERGFSHMKKMVAGWNMDLCDVLRKRGNLQQKYQSRMDRYRVSFELVNRNLLVGQNVLLVDDVCTSGASLKAAYAVIRPYIGKCEAVCWAYSRQFAADSQKRKTDWKRLHKII
ncbi:MAG: hypothetical protein HUJ58_05165 [Erysipelotrichaceae bacterium]|nr:hypothetical protein [Erysipelotrichaceae bacterium]